MTDSVNQQTTVTEYDENEKSFLTVQFFIKTLLLNWQWILLSAFIFCCLGFLYLRYTTPVYEVSAKILIKDEDNQRGSRISNQIQAATNLGLLNNSEGFDNEIEILKSVTIAEECIRDLKIYVNYEQEGRVKNHPIYESPYIVDLDKTHLDTLSVPITLEIRNDGITYTVKGEFPTFDRKDEVTFEKTGRLPMTIPTRVGFITIKPNLDAKPGYGERRAIYAKIYNPYDLAEAYTTAFSVEALSKTTTIASIIHNDVIPQRGIDYLEHLAEVYNRQANIDKNQIATRTEEFINQRLEKINAELGSTDGAIEKYKRSNNMVDLTASAAQSLTNTDETEKRLQEMDTQLLLLQNIKEYMHSPENKYQALPTNVGLTDPAATSLITQYNSIALERNRLLTSASEQSPAVIKYTDQLDDLASALKRALDQSEKNTRLERNAIAKSHSRYSSMMSQSPQQERVLTEIGRQQAVKSALYIMLLEKREENSISLAATADKGKLIDKPVAEKVKPKGSIIMLVALFLGIALPFIIVIIREMLRFRIEGHEEIVSLTKIPIIADIPVANESAKTKGEIVIQENRNNQMEEIFRSMRTNLQFMLKNKENVIMFTSSVSGEGKTFIASNLAVSFALLGKKVIIVGLDIRRPRLAALFELKHELDRGITNLLVKDTPTNEEIQKQIMPSGIVNNLDVLTAGPIPPNPAEIVSRQSLDEVFSYVRTVYDYVIVDTAPVGLVTDTINVGRVADLCVIVCRSDYTEKAAIRQFNELNQNKQLPNMCITINGIDMSKRKYGYAYGYGRYGKYGKYGKSGYYTSSSYTHYGTYSHSHYGNPEDNSIKK